MLVPQKHIGKFEKGSGIPVHFTANSENMIRNQAAQQFANQSGRLA